MLKAREEKELRIFLNGAGLGHLADALKMKDVCSIQAFTIFLDALPESTVLEREFPLLGMGASYYEVRQLVAVHDRLKRKRSAPVK